tara:strand:- start:184 stop:522 length:339 start_codon:yes stop_codon:yes gene_type:complete
MIWPPLKAWTSTLNISGQFHFVAINYGGDLIDRWVMLMSVLDSSVVVKVSWSELIDVSNWKPGWDDKNSSKLSESINKKLKTITTNIVYPSIDSGLTIPITKNIIRPWFKNS